MVRNACCPNCGQEQTTIHDPAGCPVAETFSCLVTGPYVMPAFGLYRSRGTLPQSSFFCGVRFCSGGIDVAWYDKNAVFVTVFLLLSLLPTALPEPLEDVFRRLGERAVFVR